MPDKRAYMGSRAGCQQWVQTAPPVALPQWLSAPAATAIVAATGSGKGKGFIMQVIGLCRFSYPALGGFQVEHDSIEDRMAYLYDTARMEERFRLFECITLPSLRQQSDGEFDLIIVIGDSLPDHHRARLQDLTADMPQVVIRAEPPRRHRDVMKDLLNEARDNRDAPCLQFRLDDDDAVASDFVARLRAVASDAAGLLEKIPMAAIDFNRGFIAELGPEGISATPTISPYATAALGMYVGPGVRRSIMNFAHHKIHHHMPSLTFCDAPMWLRSHNEYNDSRQKRARAVEVAPLKPELEAEFTRLFGIRSDHVRRVFSPG